jgi:hypothetical protein
MTLRLQENMQIGIRVTARTHAALAKRATEMGISTTGYAKLLFEAGFAARVGQERAESPADAELDEQVRLVFALAGQADTAAISKATGVPEPRVVRILDAWRRASAGRAPCAAAAPASTTGAQSPPSGGRPDFPAALIGKLWAEGLTAKAIAARIGKPVSSLEMWMTNHRDICPKRRNA